MEILVSPSLLPEIYLKSFPNPDPPLSEEYFAIITGG
jgi:hypothetical protein